MSLADTQLLALERLQALLQSAEVGIRLVEIEEPDSINVFPTLVIFDDGLQESRPGGGKRIIEWDLHLQVWCTQADKRRGYREALRIRANMVDRLGDDITLGGAVSNTSWRGPLSVVEIGEDPKYSGVDGVLTLVIWDARTFS